MKLTTRELIALVSIASVIGAGMYLWFTLDVTEASNVKEQITNQNKAYNEQRAKQYLMNNLLTEHQANYVLQNVHKVENKDHFIARFGAIFRHENGKEFVNGKTERLAGRLKHWMQYKPFWVQFDGRLEQYNKSWYKNNSVGDWIWKSKYCVSDYAGGKGKGCPNWQKNVSSIVAKYGFIEATSVKNAPVGTRKNEKVENHYVEARLAQDVADMKRNECILAKQCNK